MPKKTLAGISSKASKTKKARSRIIAGVLRAPPGNAWGPMPVRLFSGGKGHGQRAQIREAHESQPGMFGRRPFRPVPALWDDQC